VLEHGSEQASRCGQSGGEHPDNVRVSGAGPRGGKLRPDVRWEIEAHKVGAVAGKVQLIERIPDVLAAEEGAGAVDSAMEALSAEEPDEALHERGRGR
jgi:hypothetical protein